MTGSKTTRAKKIVASPWYDGSVDVESLSASEQLAHQLVTRHRDLVPSVERIMNAELTDDVRAHALTSFAASLDRIGDPNRDPRVAITNAAAASAVTGGAGDR